MNLKVFDVSLEGMKRFKTLDFTISIKTYMAVVLLASSRGHWVAVEQTSFLSILAHGRFPHVSWETALPLVLA